MMLPAVPVKLTLPVLARLPAFKATLPPADAVMRRAARDVGVDDHVAGGGGQAHRAAAAGRHGPADGGCAVADRLMTPPSVVIAAVPVVRLPVVATLMLPPPVSPMPMTLSVASLLTRVTSPPVVLVAVKTPTVLTSLRSAPPTELVLSVPLVCTTPASDSVMRRCWVSVTFPEPVAMLPVMLIAPVLCTVMAPAPVSLIAPVVNGWPFVKLILPALSLAVKLLTMFVLVSVVPPADCVVSRPLMVLPACSLTVPPPSRLTLPVVDTLPAASVMLPLALAVMTPEPLVTLASTITSLPTPVVVSVTVPEPLADTVPLNVAVPL